MNFLELSLYIITVVVMIATPGPVMILVASAGLKHGYRAALKTIFGTNIASLVLIAFSILVLKGVFTHSDASPTAIKPVDGGFKKGFLVGISNPKDIIFFSSFFPQFINVHDNINISLSILVITWIILDFLTLSIVYVAFNALSQKLIYHKILGACGVLLVFIAIYGLVTSIQALLS